MKDEDLVIEWEHNPERYSFYASNNLRGFVVIVASDLAGGTSWGFIIWGEDKAVAGQKNWNWNADEAKEAARVAMVRLFAAEEAKGELKKTIESY